MNEYEEFSKLADSKAAQGPLTQLSAADMLQPDSKDSKKLKEKYQPK